MEVNEQVKKIVLDKSELLFKLLLYLRENQDKKPGVSKENLAKYLRSEELSSRMTTFSIIDKLVDEGMLLDNKIMNYQSNLRINPDYNFDGLLKNILQSHIEELYPKLAKLEQFTKHEEIGYFLRQLTHLLKLFPFFPSYEGKNLSRKSPQMPQIMNEEQDKKIKKTKVKKLI